AEAALAKLQKLAQAQAQEEFTAAVDRVAQDLEAYKKHTDALLPLAENTLENSPPLKYATQIINPVAADILGAISEGVRTEGESSASGVRKKFLQELEVVRYTWAMVMDNLGVYVAFGGEENLKNLKAITDKFSQGLNKIEQQKDSGFSVQKNALKTVRVGYTKFEGALGGLINLHRSDRVREDAYRIRHDVTPVMLSLEQSLTRLSESQAALIQNSGRGMAQGLVGSIIVQLALLGSGMLLAVVVAIALSRAIVGRIVQTEHAMQSIATGEGDLTQRLPAGRDELGRMAQGFNQFAAKIHEVISHSVNALNQVNDKVQRLKILSEQTSRGADQQQNDTQQAASSVTQITASVQEVARNTAAAAKKADDVNNEAGNGRRVVAQTIDAMDSLASEVASATQVIHRLQDHSQGIGEIVDIIKKIAEQTNLLALNAAIEAARAGEQGRGFAVVADEVRTLAARTQESTKRIEEMIITLQNGAQEAVSAMDRGHLLAKQGLEQAAGAGTSLEQVTQAVGAMTEMNTHIATATEQQSATVEQLSKAIGAIHHVAEENAAGAQQTHSAINELVALNTELQSLMRQFKID
ncbi:MAG: methyl-accepting chemotaxis protein, partial [Gammaproteobacteria bacterium]|nr:methyl-accepting chemotaxis protein [Gammaproteobacteria bacterium]